MDGPSLIRPYGSDNATSSPGTSLLPIGDHEILLAVQHVGHRCAGGASRQLHSPDSPCHLPCHRRGTSLPPPYLGSSATRRFRPSPRNNIVLVTSGDGRLVAERRQVPGVDGRMIPRPLPFEPSRGDRPSSVDGVNVRTAGLKIGSPWGPSSWYKKKLLPRLASQVLSDVGSAA